ncbi:MAG: hypothetical protein Q8K92_26590 [Leadbetterella sp.]|nr:hypothetical protein [Leadbetterella sp.]
MINLKTIGGIAAALFILWAATLQYRFSQKKQALLEANSTIKTLEKTVKSQRIASKQDSLDYVKALKSQRLVSQQDSTNYANTVHDLQLLVSTVQKEKKELKAENTDLKAGLYRYRVNVFGKEKLEKKE